jgi:hypothetical protein
VGKATKSFSGEIEMSLLDERLDRVAQAFRQIRFAPWELGAGRDGFTFGVVRKNHSLVFTYAKMQVTVGDFKLVDEKDWHKQAPEAPPVIDEQRQTRNFYYSANVTFQVNGIKGERRVALGYHARVDSLLAPLSTMPERRVIGDLLFMLENQLASSYGDELLEKQVTRYPEPERCHDHLEDHGVKRIRRFLGIS